MSYDDILFWSQGQFIDQAARIIGTMPASLLFGSSHVNAGGNLALGEPLFKDGKGSLISRSDSRKPPIEVNDDKVVNIRRPDGSVDLDVLSTCLARFEETSVVSIADPSAKALSNKFKLSTGRDRLLDFIAKKSREACEQIAADVREARKNKNGWYRLKADLPPSVERLYATEWAHQEALSAARKKMLEIAAQKQVAAKVAKAAAEVNPPAQG
ncbi:MAG: hypothetical protein L6Q57_07135 [Alphaproteobacteria bacterium]|nr:hypothetical protein [Alphaproteobacteria bacterium]